MIDAPPVVARSAERRSGFVGHRLCWDWSYATTPVVAMAASTVFALGITYFWPTMLGLTAERFPTPAARWRAGDCGGRGRPAGGRHPAAPGRVYDLKGPQPWPCATLPMLPVLLASAHFFIMRLMDKARGGHHAVMREAHSRMSGGNK